MTVLDRALEVLRVAGTPHHADEIAARMSTAGWKTENKTPGGGVNARLVVEMKRRGAASRVVRPAPATWALSTPAGDETGEMGDDE